MESKAVAVARFVLEECEEYTLAMTDGHPLAYQYGETILVLVTCGTDGRHYWTDGADMVLATGGVDLMPVNALGNTFIDGRIIDLPDLRMPAAA